MCPSEPNGAFFSEDRKYRYLLWRQWDTSKPSAVFVMLNPSFANETDNDPTISRCIKRARAMGFGGIRVSNLFALCSTDPTALYSSDDAIGPKNNAKILTSVADAGIVICAWGKNGKFQERGKEVLQLLWANSITPYYLKLNKDGTPRHPLYVSYNEKPKAWEIAT